MVTNRHVVKLFAKEAKGVWFLEPGVTPVVEFPGEYNGCKPKRNTVTLSINDIKVHPELDLAMLRLDRDLPPPLQFAPGISPRIDEVVALVGYPSGDDQELPREIQDRVFRLTSGEKPMGIRRIQPGLVTEREQQTKIWRYDASSAPGNSGSPVIRIRDGAVLGIHFGAFRGVINRFIEVSEVNNFVSDVLAGAAQR
jgi:endonuclease G